MGEAVSLVIRECGADEARPWLMLADQYSTGCGVVSRQENEAGCQFWQVLKGGEVVGAFSTRLTPSTLWVVQAGGHLGGISLADSIMPWVEREAKAAGRLSVAFATRRRGLIKKLGRRGFVQSAVIVRKVLE